MEFAIEALRRDPAAVVLRRYQADDEAAAVALWLRSWQAAYPQIDFAARLAWWRARWRNELVPSCAVVIAQRRDAMAGFVTVEQRRGYLDQIVVAPEHWRSGVGAALMAAAKELSPGGLELYVNTDNDRALGFYARQGFFIAGTSVNPISGRPVQRMRWRP
jgi:putative acetyltransferase